MNYLEFFKLVRMMRVAQKKYFKNRQVDDLRQSKALEKRVDDVIMRLSESLEHDAEGGCNG